MLACFRWSASDLLHAVTIMTTFHSISCLWFGLGIKMEPDKVCSSNAPDQNSDQNIVTEVYRGKGNINFCLQDFLADSTINYRDSPWNDLEPIPV
jgi:hypothetical protein